MADNVIESAPIGLWEEAGRRLFRNKLAVICLGIIIVYIGLALLSWWGVIASQYSVTGPDSYAAPSSTHLLGTDIFGRDVLLRTIHGIRIAISIGLVTSLIASPIGVTLGAIAGYFGGRIDEFIVWFYTTMDSIPDLLKIISLSFVLSLCTIGFSVT